MRSEKGEDKKVKKVCLTPRDPKIRFLFEDVQCRAGDLPLFESSNNLGGRTLQSNNLVSRPSTNKKARLGRASPGDDAESKM